MTINMQRTAPFIIGLATFILTGRGFGGAVAGVAVGAVATVLMNEVPETESDIQLAKERFIEDSLVASYCLILATPVNGLIIPKIFLMHLIRKTAQDRLREIGVVRENFEFPTYVHINVLPFGSIKL